MPWLLGLFWKPVVVREPRPSPLGTGRALPPVRRSPTGLLHIYGILKL